MSPFAAPRRILIRLAMIKLETVTKVYKGDVVALRDASADIQKGEFVFLVGPSGSGKSTMLRLLNKEETPEHGRIFVAGKDIGQLNQWKVPYLRRNIGCVFQDFKLLTNKTVYENVAFALEVIGRPKHVIKTQVPAILELVGLAKKMGNYPHELSGWRAAAGLDRPSVREPTAHLAGRRADWKPGPDDVGGHHAAARPHQPHRHHRRHGNPRSKRRRHDAPAGDRTRPRSHRP